MSLTHGRFPRSAKYDPEWVKSSASGGANALWPTEWLAEAMDLRSGMRILDLGCGSAASSIFLRKEFGVQVWAIDLSADVTANARRIEDAGLAGGVFPLRCDARALPFASNYFDAIVAIDNFFYYGTDDLYLGSLTPFLKPGGQIGMAGAGLMQEIDGAVPEHLREWWEKEMWCLHSAAWWRRHWEKSGAVEVSVADAMPDGWRRWLDWHHAICPDNAVEIRAIEADQGAYMGYVRAVATCRAPQSPSPSAPA